jgi:hypothetical protein
MIGFIVVVDILCLLTEDNDKPIIIWPHIVFTDGRWQRQPNYNTTTYCVYWRTTTTINPIIIRPHCMFTDRRQQRQPNHNTTKYCVYWRTLLSSVSKHTMCSYYDCVYCCFRPSVNIICGRIMIGLSLLSSVSKHNMWSDYDWVYCCCRLSVNRICGRNIIVFIDGRQRQPNHNTTTYCVYWRSTTTTTQS